jgi:uncharacterized delta-60 repeat protein
MKTIFTSLVLFFLLNTMAYSQVSQAWLQRYNGPGNSSDGAQSLALDTAGNIYVTGSSSAAPNNTDYVTIKYNPAGIVQWIQRYDFGSSDIAQAVVVDKPGNVYVTGYSSSGANIDFATVKYNSSGVQQWVHRYNGTGNGADYPTAMTIDTAGEIYVTGYSIGTGGNFDYATIKFTPSNSVPIWIKKYIGASNSTDQPYDIAVDNSGNVYVTGGSIGTGSGRDYLTIKYNSSGLQQWEQRYNGPGNDYDESFSVSVDNSGNVYVLGNSVGSGTGRDCVTIKYNSSGLMQWIQRYNGFANQGDYGSELSLDNAGNVYVCGSTTWNGPGTDYLTIKYSSAGVQEWTQRYNGPQNGDEFSTSMDVDKYGSVYITGSSFGASNDIETIKYNSSGVQQWEQRYNGTANFIDLATSIAVDKSGNVYITGYSDFVVNNSDLITIKYTQPVGINTISSIVPSEFALGQNYPNPFNPATNIQFDMLKGDFVTVKIYDMLGKEIENLIDEYKPAGSYMISYDAGKLNSGVYFYRMETKNFTATKKMILVK